VRVDQARQDGGTIEIDDLRAWRNRKGRSDLLEVLAFDQDRLIETTVPAATSIRRPTLSTIAADWDAAASWSSSAQAARKDISSWWFESPVRVRSC